MLLSILDAYRLLYFGRDCVSAGEVNATLGCVLAGTWHPNIWQPVRDGKTHASRHGPACLCSLRPFCFYVLLSAAQNSLRASRFRRCGSDPYLGSAIRCTSAIMSVFGHVPIGSSIALIEPTPPLAWSCICTDHHD